MKASARIEGGRRCNPGMNGTPELSDSVQPLTTQILMVLDLVPCRKSASSEPDAHQPSCLPDPHRTDLKRHQVALHDYMSLCMSVFYKGDLHRYGLMTRRDQCSLCV